MSIELKDFRLKVTAETDAWLEAESRISGRDRQEIARDCLHRCAQESIAKARLLDRFLRSEGMGGIAGGVSGESRGT